jgi:hypothetical protein
MENELLCGMPRGIKDNTTTEKSSRSELGVWTCGAIKEYTILPVKHIPELQGLWEGDAWRIAPWLEIDYFCPESSEHHPVSQCKLLYSRDCLYGIFRVDDRYVRCVHTGFQAEVYKDSCVEFFVQPGTGGYFNFEFNCGGAILVSYITDPTRAGGMVKEFVPFLPCDGRRIHIYHTMPKVVEPEIKEKTVWYLEFSIPFAVLEKYAGVFGETEACLIGQSACLLQQGRVWRANFYKCGNDTSHPHWGSWSPINERNFHLPEKFGNIRFAK